MGKMAEVKKVTYQSMMALLGENQILGLSSMPGFVC